MWCDDNDVEKYIVFIHFTIMYRLFKVQQNRREQILLAQTFININRQNDSMENKYAKTK